MAGTKIATCCYCGSRAALVLVGDQRHELACSNCGAPLHELKMLPKTRDRVTAATPTPTRPVPKGRSVFGGNGDVKRPKKHKKKKSMKRKAFGAIWDVIEDIID